MSMRCFRVHTGNVTRAGYPLIFYMHIRTTSKEEKPDKGNRWDTTKKREKYRNCSQVDTRKTSKLANIRKEIQKIQ